MSYSVFKLVIHSLHSSLLKKNYFERRRVMKSIIVVRNQIFIKKISYLMSSVNFLCFVVIDV